MSGILPLLEQKDAVKKSIQHLTFTESRLFDSSNQVRVDICHHLLEQQTRKVKQLDSILVNLFQSKENNKNVEKH